MKESLFSTLKFLACMGLGRVDVQNSAAFVVAFGP